MSFFISPANTHHIIEVGTSGLRHDFIDSYGADSNPLTMPTIETANSKQAPSGIITATKTGIVGGDISLILAPNSNGVQWLNSLINLQNSGESYQLNGYTYYQESGIRVVHTKGLLKSYPVAPTLGQTDTPSMTYVFTYQVITAFYEGVNFD